MNILDYNVARAVMDTQSLPAQHTAISHTDNTFVTPHAKGRLRSIPIRAFLPRSAIARVVDPELTSRCSVRALGRAVVAAALIRGAPFRLEEVESLVEHNDARGVVAKEFGEPIVILE